MNETKIQYLIAYVQKTAMFEVIVGRHNNYMVSFLSLSLFTVSLVMFVNSAGLSVASNVNKSWAWNTRFFRLYVTTKKYRK